MRFLLPVLVLLAAMTPVAAQGVTQGKHEPTVVVVSSNPLPDARSVGEKYGVDLETFTVPRTPEEFQRFPWTEFAEAVKRADVLLVQEMGELPAAFVEKAEKEVAGRTYPSLEDFLKALAPGKKVVILARFDPRRALVIVNGRPAIAEAPPGVRKAVDAAIAAHVWLCLTSADTEALLTFLLWLAYPSFPASKVVPPANVTRAALSAYVVGQGWVSMVDEKTWEKTVKAFREWMSELARANELSQSEANNLVFVFSIGMHMAFHFPTWVMPAFKGLFERYYDVIGSFVRKLPDRMVLVLVHGQDVFTSKWKVIEEMAEKLQRVASGFGDRVVVLVCDPPYVKPVDVLEEIREEGKHVDVIVDVRAFPLGFPSLTAGEWTLEKLGAPLIQVIFPLSGDTDVMTLSKYPWEGMGPFLEWMLEVVEGSQYTGSFWFRVLWLNDENGEPIPLPGTLDDLAEFVYHLLRLKHAPNRDKRIVLMTYCYPPGRSELAASFLNVPRSLANVLTVLAEHGYGIDSTLVEAMARAKERGDEREFDFLRDVFVRTLEELFSEVGLDSKKKTVLVFANLGNWARGELERMFELYEGGTGETTIRVDGKEVRIIVRDREIHVVVDGRDYLFARIPKTAVIPADEVKEWFERDVVSRLEAYLELARKYCGEQGYESVKRYVEWMLETFRKEWGDVHDNKGVMIVDHRYYLVPILSFGNVVVMLQPIRGWSADEAKFYHSPTLPPSWQYFAAYEWIRRVFHADAVVYMGTHGTFEFLPGHRRGLTVTDWTYLLLPDVPQAYFYIVSNPGEGLLAKYRAGAVILTYPSPPVDYFEDFREYQDLDRLVSEYLQVETQVGEGSSNAFGGAARKLSLEMEKLKEEILKEAAEKKLLKTVVGLCGGDVENAEKWASEHFDRFVHELHDYLLDLEDQKVHYGLHAIGENLDLRMSIREAAILYAPRFAPYFATAVGLTPYARISDFDRLQYEDPDKYVAIKKECYNLLKLLLWDLYNDRTLRSVLERYTELMDEGEVKGGTSEEMTEAANLLMKHADEIWRIFVKDVELLGYKVTKVGWDYEYTVVKQIAAAYRLFVHIYEAGRYEIKGLLTFLSGGHVPPGGFGEPLWNPDAYPPGRNGVPFNPYSMPTPLAWNVAVQLVNEQLARYYEEHHSWPRMVAIVLFAAHELTTGGLGVAEALYLMGVEPVWNPDNGRVEGVKVIPLQDLKVKIDGKWVRRPRIDVMVFITAVMAGLTPLIQLLAEAGYVVSHLKESPEWNYRRADYLEVYDELVKAGVKPSEADLLASAVVFGEPPNDPSGTGVSRLIETGWASLTNGIGLFVSSSDFRRRILEHVAELVQRRLMHAYVVKVSSAGGYPSEGSVFTRGMVTEYEAGVSGKAVEEAFNTLVRKLANGIVVDFKVNAYNLLRVNDYYSWIGAITSYVYKLTGKSPEVFIHDASDPTTARVESLLERISLELRTTIMSPSWVEAMMKQGDSGWTYIDRYVRDLVGFASTVLQFNPKARAMFSVLMTHTAEAVLKILTRYQPHTTWGWTVVQSTLSWIVESARVGLWKPSRTLLKNIIVEWVKATAKVGPSTCHHTSPNVSTLPWVVQQAQILGIYQQISSMIPQALANYAVLDSRSIVSQIVSNLAKISPSLAAKIVREAAARLEKAYPTKAEMLKKLAREIERNARAVNSQQVKSNVHPVQHRTSARTTPTSSTTSALSRLTRSVSRAVASAVSQAVASVMKAVAAVIQNVVKAVSNVKPGTPSGGKRVMRAFTGISLTGQGLKYMGKGQAPVPVVRNPGGAAAASAAKASRKGASKPSRPVHVMTKTPPTATPPTTPPRMIWLWVAAMLATILVTYVFLRRRYRGVGVGRGRGPAWVLDAL